MKSNFVHKTVPIQEDCEEISNIEYLKMKSDFVHKTVPIQEDYESASKINLEKV